MPGSSSAARMVFHSRPVLRAVRSSATRLERSRSLSAFSRNIASSSSSARRTSSSVPPACSVPFVIRSPALSRRTPSCRSSATSVADMHCLLSSQADGPGEPRAGKRVDLSSAYASLSRRVTPWGRCTCLTHSLSFRKHREQTASATTAVSPDGPRARTREFSGNQPKFVGSTFNGSRGRTIRARRDPGSRSARSAPPRPGGPPHRRGAATRPRTPARWPGPGWPHRSTTAHRRG